MEYKYLRARGALNEAEKEAAPSPEFQSRVPGRLDDLATRTIPSAVVELIPESVARENLVMPLAWEGETLYLAAANPDDIALSDKLCFILNKNVRLVGAPREAIIKAINRHYGHVETTSVDSLLVELTDTADFELASAEPPRSLVSTTRPAPGHRPSWAQGGIAPRVLIPGASEGKGQRPRPRHPGLDRTPPF